MMRREEEGNKPSASVYTLSILLGISLLANFFILLNWFNAPEYKLGTLVKDVEVVIRPVGREEIILTLPKGLTVKNETPRGLARILLLAPYRFSIYVADGEPDLVDYTKVPVGDELYFTKRTETGDFR